MNRHISNKASTNTTAYERNIFFEFNDFDQLSLFSIIKHHRNHKTGLTFLTLEGLKKLLQVKPKQGRSNAKIKIITQKKIRFLLDQIYQKNCLKREHGISRIHRCNGFNKEALVWSFPHDPDGSFDQWQHRTKNTEKQEKITKKQLENKEIKIYPQEKEEEDNSGINNSIKNSKLNEEITCQGRDTSFAGSLKKQTKSGNEEKSPVREKPKKKLKPKPPLEEVSIEHLNFPNEFSPEERKKAGKSLMKNVADKAQAILDEIKAIILKKTEDNSEKIRNYLAYTRRLIHIAKTELIDFTNTRALKIKEKIKEKEKETAKKEREKFDKQYAEDQKMYAEREAAGKKPLNQETIDFLNRMIPGRERKIREKERVASLRLAREDGLTTLEINAPPCKNEEIRTESSVATEALRIMKSMLDPAKRNLSSG